MSHIKLYTRENVKDLQWNQYKNGLEAMSFLKDFTLYGPGTYIDNIQTKFMLLTLDDLILPITVNQKEYDNSYICSPYSHYITGASEEIKLLKSSFLKCILRSFLQVLSPILKWGKINQVVCVNNWLVSTNLYPELSPESIKMITDFLVLRFPTHAIMFRSLNTSTDTQLLTTLSKNGYIHILARQIYLLEPQNAFRKNMVKKDLKLLQNSYYRVEDVVPSEASNIQKLYSALYLEKYTRLNPQYNEKYFKLALKSKLFSIIGFSKESNISAFFAVIQSGNLITMPFLGYNTSLNEGLYRMISTEFLLRGNEKKLLLHMSAGAASFKLLRGAKGYLEYTAVNIKHLPKRQRIPWKILRYMLNPIGEYFLKKYKL